ncbi:glycosyl hydrolase [Mucilaginibacter sp.]|uniref:glycosyl hydrolase n=1 Tax=Mucilaginibacter sp. TaxID=1882438 RepID=UPI002613B8DA|nr:glycosyl hydrolase [Mucilaginibacter sp.]MDB4919575.1 DNA-binding protein [Mucilaginibacter sp.]
MITDINAPLRGMKSIADMKKFIQIILLYLCMPGWLTLSVSAQVGGRVMVKDELEQTFLHPPQAAKPWVFWYWMQASITREGITADLKALQKEGIGGVYLMTIKGPATPSYINPPVQQLTKPWWDMIRFAMSEADKYGVKVAMHDCDGFAVAGGPWITPELSMQKVVWTKTLTTGGKLYNDTLPQPQSYKGYYKDIKVLAYPSPEGSGITTKTMIPKVTASTGADVQFLVEPDNKKSFTSNEPCWIQLAFDAPFTCRSLVIHANASNFQSERMGVEYSNDGKNFKNLTQLEPPRSGWQDGDADITNDIIPVTARYFRLTYDKAGTEPGAEDIDFAKWKPTLKFSGIVLSSESEIHQFEGKTGKVWRISKRTTKQQVPDNLCIPKDKIIDITNELDANGRVNWNVPVGNWTILRIGHTSTGRTNATGGVGSGLECDKFSTEAAKVQFDHWFGEVVKQVGPDVAKRVLKIFHIDSWECGSQNWSPVFAAEFKKRRGYDLLPYLPVMAGVPVQSADVAEKVLSDVRQTIAELVVANFYGTMAKLAHAEGYSFSAESVAPVFTSDGMLHYSQADIPMGEFWLRSPTHDKPNDMLDVISGGHIYGKNIIQAEAFTELRLMWDEHPAMLKGIADRNFAAGINRYVFHVDVLNPWLNRKPGMTLDGIGAFFQRDQTWWKPGEAWIQYIQHCEAILQMGHPVTDIAVFTGEETPRRAILPDRLVSTLPGIFGEERVKQEAIRLANKGNPMRVIPDGVTNSANMADPDKWVDALHGYAYDSINLDALLRLATVKSGRIVLPGGASYGILVIPGSHPMSPDSSLMSPQAIKKIRQLVKDGATIIMNSHPIKAPGIADDQTVKRAAAELFTASVQKGRLLTGPYHYADFNKLGIIKDVIVTDSIGNYARDIAWNHRTGKGFDSYFISNQHAQQRTITLSLRSSGRIPELWDALTGEIRMAGDWKIQNGRTVLPVKLDGSGSVFVILRHPAKVAASKKRSNWPVNRTTQTLKEDWTVKFDRAYGGPQPVAFTSLQDWSKNADEGIKYYSGTASYNQTFTWQKTPDKDNEVWLDLGKVDNLADVYLNGVHCGTAWTYPYRVNIGKALKKGNNELRIEVSNTWANRIIGDQALPEDKRITWTNAPFRLDKKPLLPAGLLGPVKIIEVSY